MTLLKSHDYYMERALIEARKAAERGEVPTGCLIVYAGTAGPVATGQILARAHNQVETLGEATAHAEMLAISQAAATLGDWRLTDSILYVTKEPCAMCAGAIVLARIPTVVYGAEDPRRGGHSVFGILDSPALNHRAEVIPRICEAPCAQLLRDFFAGRRGQGERGSKGVRGEPDPTGGSRTDPNGSGSRPPACGLHGRPCC